MKQVVKLNEAQLREMIKESIQKTLNENASNEGFMDFMDGIAKRLPWTDDYRMHQNAEQIRQRRAAEREEYNQRRAAERAAYNRGGQNSATRTQSTVSRQPSTQPRNDIYTQTIQALNSNNYQFFRQGGKRLQGVLSGLYNQNKITYNEYNRGMQMIGQGYQYSQASGNYNW